MGRRVLVTVQNGAHTISLRDSELSSATVYAIVADVKALLSRLEAATHHARDIKAGLESHDLAGRGMGWQGREGLG